MAKAQIIKLSYDEAYAELNSILESLQNGQTGLDELTDKLRRASALSTYCQQKLRNLEEEISRLQSTENI